MNRAVFFDRDNTLIVDVPYSGDPAAVRLMPFAREALHWLDDAGFDLVVISNQSAVGRGLIRRDQVDAVNREMERQLGRRFFKGMYFCFDDPDRPEDNCRKPSPMLILRAAGEHSIDLSRSFMVGDRESDLEAGRRAGCRTVLVHGAENSQKSDPGSVLADYRASHLLDAARWIIESGSRSSRKSRERGSG